MSEPLRLSKCIVALTGCSRREAELYIEGGWVLVDGRAVEEPQFMVDTQKVELAPGAKPEPVEPVTILLHKPAGYDLAQPDPPIEQLFKSAMRVIDQTDPPVRVLRRHFVRLSAALPLEKQAGGLQVFTHDWPTLRKLTDDAGRIEQEYVAQVEGQIAEDGLARLNQGLSVDGWLSPTCKVSWQNETHLRFAGKAIQAGQIERMCAAVGLQAIAVKRLRIGQIAMSKLLPGQWRYLPAFKRF